MKNPTSILGHVKEQRERPRDRDGAEEEWGVSQRQRTQEWAGVAHGLSHRSLGVGRVGWILTDGFVLPFLRCVCPSPSSVLSLPFISTDIVRLTLKCYFLLDTKGDKNMVYV